MWNVLVFDECKKSIMEALETRWNMGINESVTLVDGFVNQPISDKLDNNFTVGGPSIPMIMLVWGDSWRIYYFALKALLPNINF